MMMWQVRWREELASPGELPKVTKSSKKRAKEKAKKKAKELANKRGNGMRKGVFRVKPL